MGSAHLLFDNGMLYVLSGDYLYSADLKNYKSGGAPFNGATLPFEDIGTWVLAQNIVNPDDSHPYNLIKEIDGKIFFEVLLSKLVMIM